MQARTRRPSPALVVAIIALIASLTGTAWAALGKNSVGSKQIKSKAVTTGKIANNAITGIKVAAGTLTGDDINLTQLGTVPNATNAVNAQNTATIGAERYSAACPGGSTEIRGVCFDLVSSGPIVGVKNAADACANKGGYLPTPMELFSVRNVINLGTGVGKDKQLTDNYYSNGAGGNYKTVTVDGNGTITEFPIEGEAKFICAYSLVRK